MFYMHMHVEVFHHPFWLPCILDGTGWQVWKSISGIWAVNYEMRTENSGKILFAVTLFRSVT
jgi:hypothetical protein